MTSRVVFRIAMFAGLIMLVSQDVQAQYRSNRYRSRSRSRIGSPFNRPALSPYQSLLRPGGSIANNYLNIVRPELRLQRSTQANSQAISQSFQQTQQSLQQLRSDTTLQLQQFQQQAAGSVLSTTGHTSSFMNTGRYFGGGAGVGGQR